MRKEIEKRINIVWDTLDNLYGVSSLCQHAFVSSKRGKYFDKYDGNKSLCGKIGAHDGDKYIALKDFDGEELNEDKACKTCLKIYNKRYQQMATKLIEL